MKYEISKLETNDVSKLIELLENVFGNKICFDSVMNLINNDEVIDLVVRHNNQIIGHAMAEIRYDLFTNEKYFYLNYFCVHKDYRCRGIGQNLLLKIEKLAKEYSINYMKFTSGNKRIDAHRFYKNRGYKIRDTSVFIKYF